MNKQPLSAEQYIKSRVRTLKIDRCLINDDWETSKFAHVIVIRRHPLAHNIIFAGNDLATEYHIPQHTDFVSVTHYLLEEDDDKIPLIEMHTGDEDGLPHLIVSAENKQPVALARLKEHAGEGGFRYTVLEEDEFISDNEDEDKNTDDDWDSDQADFSYWNKGDDTGNGL